jgi:hypothetical protein
MTGRFIPRFGRRRFMIGNCIVWACGILLTLIPWLSTIIAGLAICAFRGLISQAISTGYVMLTARETFFYIGGRFGAFAAG